MPIANLTLLNTFDEWRTTTNQLITFVNDIDSGNLTKFYSNSAVLTVSENIARGGKNFITLNVSSDVLDTSVLNVATANAVNIIFSSLGDTNETVNAVFTKTNTTTIISVGAFNQANTARDGANVAFAAVTSALIIGNGAFGQANVARNHANAAFANANTVMISAQAAFTVANASFLHANAAFANANTVMISAQAGFAAANLGFAHANASYAFANSSHNIANLAFTHANNAYVTANLAYEFALTVSTNTVANVIISNKASYDHANAAFDKANAALANVSTTFNGNLRFPTGNVTIGLPTEQGIRLHVTHGSSVSNVLPEARFVSGLQFTHINSNTAVGAWNDLTLARDHTIIYSNGSSDDSANLIIGPWTDSSFGYKQDGAGRHGFNTSNPRFTIDANGSANISGSLIVAGINVLDQITTVGTNVGTGANVYTREVGIAGNNYTREVGLAANTFANTVGTAGNNYTLTISAAVGAGANVYTREVGTAGNNYTREVGSAINTFTSYITANAGLGANAFATSIGINIGTGANVYTREVGTAGNNYTREVGTAGNNYTRTVGLASNTYADSIGTSASNYTRTVGTAGNNYTNTVGAAASNYTREVGAAGNTYADSVGTAASNYTRTVGTAGNTYTTVVFNRANTINIKADLAFIHANQAFAKANAALVNEAGLALAGDLIMPRGNLTIGEDSSLGTRLSVNNWIGVANVFPQVEIYTGSHFIQFGANTSFGAWNDLVLNNDNTIIYGNFPADARANLVIAPWSDSSFGYKQDHQGRHGFNTSNPRFTIDANGSANISGSLIVAGTNVINYTREVGTAGNNYMLTTGAAIGAGANVFSSSATNLTTGTVPAARLSGSYTGITGVGTITAGAWAATDIGLEHGGTNASLIASAGAVTYSTASALALSAVGVSGQVLTSGGAGAPTWTNQSGLSVGFATNLSTTRDNWSTNGTLSAVVGQLAWKNYGNGHTIIDASSGTAPNGAAINNTNATSPWSASYPTLVGWNGSATYGVRVDSARVADSAGNADTLDGYDSSAFFNASNINAGTLSSARLPATTSITGVGTITTGVWNASAIPVTNGGTGATNAGTARTNLGIGTMATRGIFISTAGPSGGADGDVWLQYV